MLVLLAIMLSFKKHYFTVKEVIRNIIRYERKYRCHSKAPEGEGIDAHNIFFDGLSAELDDTYCIHWHFACRDLSKLLGALQKPTIF
jgi:hypothetical protein